MKLTEKVKSVLKMYGLTMERLRDGRKKSQCKVRLVTGDICYITGASGSGKSLLLNELYDNEEQDQKIRLCNLAIESGKSLVDCIEGDFFEALRILSKAGLSDVFCVLNEPTKLSSGQQYRYRLAKALASNKQIIFADDFCSGLDRITAAVISHNIRKIAKQSGKIFVLASSHDDLLCDLQPDIVVIKHMGDGKDEIIYKDKRRQAS